MADDATHILLRSILDQVGDLREDVGGVNARLDSGAQLHKTLSQQIDMIDRRTDIIEDKIVTVESVLTPDEGPTLAKRVAELEIFKGKVGAVLFAAGTVAAAAFSLIWNGIYWIFSHWAEIRASLGRLFHS